MAPRYLPPRVNVARLYFQVQNYGQAVKHFREASALDPKNARLLGDTAAAEAYAGMVERDPQRKIAFQTSAEDHYKQALAKESFPAFYNGLGFLYQQTNQADKAAEVYQQWATKHPKDALALSAQARLKEFQKKPDEAKTLYLKAIALA